jgi:hypothetical protein
LWHIGSKDWVSALKTAMCKAWSTVQSAQRANGTAGGVKSSIPGTGQGVVQCGQGYGEKPMCSTR